MPLLVHLTSDHAARAVRRSGIRTSWHRHVDARGVFCMPVLPSYVLTHQWGRELRKRGYRTTMAVRFRVPDDEAVWGGHFNRKPERMTAAEAVALVGAHPDPRGFELFVPRSVAAGEIHDLRHVNRLTGWRYYPDAHGHRPCPCPWCVRGEYGARKIRANA